jgi:hypothetical protein
VLIPSYLLGHQPGGKACLTDQQDRNGIYFPSSEFLRADAWCNIRVVMRPSMIVAAIGILRRYSSWCVRCHHVWLGGRTKRCLSLCVDVLDVLAGQNRDREDRGISHSVMRDLGVRERVVFYTCSDAMKEEVAYISDVVLLYNHCTSHRSNVAL